MSILRGALLAVGGLLWCGSVEGARTSRTKLANVPVTEDTFDKDDDRAEEQTAEHRIATAGVDVDSSDVGVASGANCARSSSGRRVVSVADFHGDFEGMVDHLQRLGFVKSGVSRSSSTWSSCWVGGNAILVQTGDILDRGPDGRVMYKFLWALQDDAPRQSGRVVLLPGNHELMVLQGDVRYVTDIDFCAYTNSSSCSGSGNYPDSPCNYANGRCRSNPSSCMRGNCEFIASWDRNGEMGAEMRKRFREGKMLVAYEINGMVFTHAGLVSSIWSKVRASSGQNPIDKLNSLGANLFSSSTGYDLWYSSDVIAATGSQGGPLWTRMCYDDWYTASGRRRRNGGSKPYYMDVDEFDRLEGSSRCSVVRNSLRALNGTRMVIGHCPQRDGTVQQSCSNRFIQADTYMSIAYTGSRSRSKRNQAAIEFYSGDSQQRAWIVYAGRNVCEELPEKSPA